MARLPDCILQWSDYVQHPKYRTQAQGGGAPTSYEGMLAFLYTINQGEPLPAKPRPITRSVDAFIDSGRWMWLCTVCNSANFVELGSPTICTECGVGSWTNVNLPTDDDLDDIVEELLKQPGFRDAAPIRSWQPGQTIEQLRDRTRRATEKMTRDGKPPRSLSIGATRAWAVAEILTAANMITFLSDVLDDLAGRNGEVQWEGPVKVNDGAGQYLELPVLTTAERDALTPAEGMIIKNSTKDLVEVYESGAWVTGTIGVDTSLVVAGDTLIGQSAGVWGFETAMTQGQAEAGTDTQVRGVTAERIGQAITALAPATEASQADMEAETASTLFVPPDLVRNSPGVAKVWCSVTSGGVLESPDYGVSTVTVNATGNITVNFTTAFSTAVFVVVVSTETPIVNNEIIKVRVANRTTTSVDVLTYGGTGGNTLEGIAFMLAIFGDN